MKQIYEVFENCIGRDRINSHLFEKESSAKEYINNRAEELKNKLEVVPDQTYEFKEFDHSKDIFELHTNRIGLVTFDYYPLQCSDDDDRWTDDYEIVLEKRELLS